MTLCYRHVLVAVDLSEQDTYVVQKARHLAQVFHAKLSTIHVLDNIPMPDTAYGTIIPLNEDSSYEMLEAVKAKLHKLGEWMAIDPELRWLVWGVPGKKSFGSPGRSTSILSWWALMAGTAWVYSWDPRRTVCCIMLRAMSWQSVSRKRLNALHRYRNFCKIQQVEWQRKVSRTAHAESSSANCHRALTRTSTKPPPPYRWSRKRTGCQESFFPSLYRRRRANPSYPARHMPLP